MTYIPHAYKRKTLCAKCSRTFSAKTSNQKYCSKDCWGQVYKNSLGISTGTTGAISELIASIDLMKKGFEVYRALSPSSSSDILGYKDKKVYRFEVRTGMKIPNFGGKIHLTYSKQNVRAPNMAVVILRDNEIYYYPSIFISDNN